MASVDFYFDLSCPHSYMISTQINQMCAKYGIIPKWHPFLKSLTAIKPYTSASEKLRYNDRLLLFYAQRFVPNCPIFYQRLKTEPCTLDAMIFLTSVYNDQQNVLKCVRNLFSSIWEDADQSNKSIDLFRRIESLKDNGEQYNALKQRLQQNTQNAAKQFNIFTTPSIVVSKKHLFVGVERLKNVDFSSPWAYIGYCRLSEMSGFVKEIKFRPILLGALFRDIGTPNAPALAMSGGQREYGSVDLERWRKIAGVKLEFTSHFPLRTVLPLRVYLIENKTIDCLFKGAWQWNVNIGDPNELKKLLIDFGFDGESLIARAKSDQKIKKILRDNTEFAKSKGMFGVPSYVVNDDYDRFLWGQDKMDLVKDLCCGWTPKVETKAVAKL